MRKTDTHPHALQPTEADGGLPNGWARSVHDACHRWLLQRDLAYARGHAMREADRAAGKGTGFTIHRRSR